MNIEHLGTALVSLDHNRVIVEANQSAGHLIGVHAKDLIGQRVADAMRPRKPSGEDLLIDDWHPSAYLSSVRRIAEQDVLLRRANGLEIEVQVDGGYIRSDSGDLLGANLLMRPRRGVRKPAAGIRIVSAVSHELRSPLTSVRGYVSLLLKRWEEISDDDRKQMMLQVDRDARRISRMINELLDISRLETGNVQLNRTRFDLIELINNVIETVRITYPSMAVEIQSASDLQMIWADVDKINQVLINLLENACKYGSEVGIVLSISTTSEDVIVELSDQGPGIPQVDMPKLFQQFFRSSQGRPTGIGLGLWISRGLIESHGGSLSFVSNKNVGSTFRFNLPQQLREENYPYE